MNDQRDFIDDPGTKCDWCDEVVSNDRARRYLLDSVCEPCAEREGFIVCHGCQQWTPAFQAKLEDGLVYCIDCVEHDRLDSIKDPSRGDSL